MTGCHETEVEHRAHNPKVAGSNPAPATKRPQVTGLGSSVWGVVTLVSNRFGSRNPVVFAQGIQITDTAISMREEDWTSLVFSVEQGNCILMLGPDAVTVTFEGELLPVLIGLARFVKKKLGPDFDYLDASNPSAVAQVAVAEEDHFTLQGWVQEFYDNLETAPAVLDDLAAIPFRLVINTSPVLGVDQAFLSTKPDTYVDFYDRTAPTRASFPDPSVEAPVVYNLYGSLSQPTSLILSDSDRLEFLVSVISENPPLPAKLKSALKDPKRTFLFLGFSLHHWQLRVLVHVLAADAKRHFKSFAVELERSNLDPETRLFYKMGHKIQFPDTDVEEFIQELRRRVRPQQVAAESEAQSGDHLPPDAPVVFLCHASADKQYVYGQHVYVAD